MLQISRRRMRRFFFARTKDHTLAFAILAHYDHGFITGHHFMTRLLQFFFTLLSRLPLPWVHALGTGLGGLVWWLAPGLRRVVRTNLQLAWPEMAGPAREKLARQVLRETGKSVLELGHLWMLPPEQAIKLVRKVHGQEWVDAARAQGKGVLLAIPHLGAWEMMAVYFGLAGPAATLYRPPRQKALHPLIIQGRARAGAELIPADRKAVRAIMRALQQGKVVGVLPDQQPKQGEGVFAPFFSREAWTMTLLPRLAAKLEVPVVFGAVVRLPRGQGYALHFRPPEPELTHADPQAAAAALNANVAGFASRWPAQYQWTYKRWSMQPEGVPSPYQTL